MGEPPPSPKPVTAAMTQARALVKAGKFERGAGSSAAAGPRPRGRGERTLPHRPDGDRRIAAARSCGRRAGCTAGRGYSRATHHADRPRPGLVRVRLELARAFFLKGEDSLARSHFERVLAGKPAAIGGGQRTAVSGRDPGAPPLDDVSRRRNVARTATSAGHRTNRSSISTTCPSAATRKS